MPRIWLVRHGRAVAGFGTHRDPGLDELGLAQAEAVAERLAPIGPVPILVSPLRRTRETAQPLEQRWETGATIEPRVAEIPSPTDDLRERSEWIRRIMASSWDELGDEQHAWRRDVVEALLGIDGDSVVFTHFVAINVALGSAGGHDAVVSEVLENGSITVVDHDGQSLSVVESPDPDQRMAT